MEFFKLASANFKLIISSALIFALSACSFWQPYVDRRRNAGNPPERLYVGRSTPYNPSICYNGWVSDAVEVQKLADDECLKYKTGDKAVLVNTQRFDCKIFVPSRANFKCEKNNNSNEQLSE